MYFLTNYDDILNVYKNAAGHSREEADVEEADFYKEMEDLKNKLLKKTAAESPESREVLTRREADEIAQMYYHLYQKLNQALKDKKPLTVLERDTKHCMQQELDNILFMDTKAHQPMNELLDSADAGKRENAIPTVAHPNNRYLAVKVDQSFDLHSDARFMGQMHQYEFTNAKRNVHGSSDQFDAMEIAFLQTKRLLDHVSLVDDAEQILPDYRRSLKKLYDAAHTYQTYKENATARRGLKEKEERRIAFSKMLQQFAGSRLEKFQFNEKQKNLMTILENKERETEIRNSRRYNENYAVRMKHLQKKLEENEGNCFAVNLLRSEGLASEKESAENCVNDVTALLKGAFGGFAGEDQLPGREEFLSTGKPGSEFLHTCSKRTRDAYFGKDPQFAKARNTAVDALIRRLSSMDRFSEQFITFAGMTSFLAEDHSNYDEPLREEQKTAVSGIQDLVKAVKAGSESRKTLMNMNRRVPGEYADDMLNVALMQALEAGMKAYAQNPAGKVHPLFVHFAKNPDFAAALRAKIAASEEFRRFEEKSLERPQTMIMNSYTGNDAGFAAMLKTAFAKTVKECEDRSLQNENKHPEDSHQNCVNNNLHPDPICSFAEKPKGLRSRANSLPRRLGHQENGDAKLNAAAEEPQAKVHHRTDPAAAAKKLQRRNSVSVKTAHSISKDPEMQNRIRRTRTFCAVKKQENRPASAPAHQL